jgi:CRP/FNR family cyclic AMP-dependent transcriptional regulator
MAARGVRKPAAKGAPTRSPDEALVARIAERGTVCSYPRSAIIQTEGTPGDTLCLVLSGRLKVYVGDEHRHEVRVDTLVPGDCVGLAMIDGGRRAVSVKTLTPVKACLLTRSEVDKLIVADRGFTKYLLLRLVQRARALTGTVRSLALQDVRGRVVGLLLELARDEGGSRVVRPRLRQREIADRVGASTGMVSKVVRDLVADGFITVRSTGIVVHRAPVRSTTA